MGRWKETSEGGEESRKGRKKEKKFSRTGGNQKQQNAQIVKIYQFNVDLNDGQFSERCDVDGSFFNSSMFWPVLVFGVFMLIVGVLC